MQYPVITVYLNIQVTPDGHMSCFLSGYREGDAVTPVFTYVGKPDYTPAMNAQDAYRLFNAPEEYLSADDLAITKRYRANRLRSLSVGDIVQVNGEMFTIQPVGFSELDVKLNIQPNAFDNFGRNEEPTKYLT